MLTENQIESHRTFGFVGLLQHVDAATVVALTEESDDALGDAFGARLADRSDPGGQHGAVVPRGDAVLWPDTAALQRRHG
jgi:hypothetical protein